VAGIYGVQVVDAEAAVREWANGFSALCGKGNPLANGVHLGPPRSPSAGAIAGMQLISPRQTIDYADDARVSFSVKAVGGETAARLLAQRAANALAEAVLSMRGRPTVVTIPGGGQVRILCCDNLDGPTYAGDQGGESTYLVDATFRMQGA
jgi:hypothetical protein